MPYPYESANAYDRNSGHIMNTTALSYNNQVAATSVTLTQTSGIVDAVIIAAASVGQLLTYNVVVSDGANVIARAAASGTSGLPPHVLNLNARYNSGLNVNVVALTNGNVTTIYN